MGLDFLAKILAEFLSKFKTNNPLIFLVIAAVLTAVKYILESGVALPISNTVAEWILWVASLVLGTHTTALLQKLNGDK